MRFSYKDLEKIGRVVKQDDIYTVSDFSMRNLVVSKTVLYPNKNTRGHFHDVDEVYYFVEGSGRIKLDNELIDINAGDVVIVTPNVFHQVFNHGESDLIFLSIFEKYGERR